MKILVTGGAGFVGSNLCRELIKSGNHVWCLDNFYTSSTSNIEDLINNRNFTLVERDVVSPIELHVDQIYNLACPASPIHYQRDAIRTFETSVMGAINVLELAKRLKCRVLQASTSEVYGDPEVHPQPESYKGSVNPIGVRACYDEGKRGAETLFFDYHRQHGVDIRVVRIFNTYGPGMDQADGRVVSNFIVQALSDRDLTVYGDGAQTRSFQYVDDLVRGMILMMNNEENLIGPVNLGNPREFTILELAELVLRKVPRSRSKLLFKDLPGDDPKQRRPVIELAQSSLGWCPSVTLEEGLDKTIDYFYRKLL